MGAFNEIEVGQASLLVGAAPQHDEMVEEVCAFTHDARFAALHRLERDLARLLNDLLCRAPS